MPGIEPTSARNWDHHRPALGTLIFHCHVDISILFSWGTLAPCPRQQCECTRESLSSGCALICPSSACYRRWWIMLRKWMDAHKKAGLVLRGFYQRFLGIAPWMSVIKLLYLWLRLKIALQFEKTVSRVEKSVQNWNHVLYSQERSLWDIGQVSATFKASVPPLIKWGYWAACVH